MQKAITLDGVGEYDGNQVAADGSDGYLYMYGPDGDRLFETIKPILMSTDFTKNAFVKIRYGDSERDAKIRESTTDSTS